jgi:hypothetical protein
MSASFYQPYLSVLVQNGTDIRSSGLDLRKGPLNAISYTAGNSRTYSERYCDLSGRAVERIGRLKVVNSQQRFTVADQRARTLLDGEQAIAELWAFDGGRSPEEQAPTPVDTPSDTSLSPDYRTGQPKQITDLTSGLRQQNCAADEHGRTGAATPMAAGRNRAK